MFFSDFSNTLRALDHILENVVAFETKWASERDGPRAIETAKLILRDEESFIQVLLSGFVRSEAGVFRLCVGALDSALHNVNAACCMSVEIGTAAAEREFWDRGDQVVVDLQHLCLLLSPLRTLTREHERLGQGGRTPDPETDAKARPDGSTSPGK